MPTILEILGWRLFFYSNEGDEPVHVHAKKAEMECKYWIDVDAFDILEAYAYRLKRRDRREIRRIVFDHFDYIVDQWEEFQRRRESGEAS
jgi:hypothetical protein